MRFIIGIDAGQFPGEEIERALRPYYDIADYDIVPHWQEPGFAISQPEEIPKRAHALVNELYQKSESALCYIGLTRGYYLCQVPQGGRLDIFSICVDAAVATDRFKKNTVCVCLNSTCISARHEGNRTRLTDNAETLQSLLTLISSFCAKEPITIDLEATK